MLLFAYLLEYLGYIGVSSDADRYALRKFVDGGGMDAEDLGRTGAGRRS
jgi:hypothetical protein